PYTTLFRSSYAAMAVAGLLIAGLFQLLGLAPAHFHAAVFETRPGWDYTTWLDLAALVLVALLGWRFLGTGGPEMLRMMAASGTGHPEQEHHHGTDQRQDHRTAKPEGAFC